MKIEAVFVATAVLIFGCSESDPILPKTHPSSQNALSTDILVGTSRIPQVMMFKLLMYLHPHPLGMLRFEFHGSTNFEATTVALTRLLTPLLFEDSVAWQFVAKTILGESAISASGVARLMLFVSQFPRPDFDAVVRGIAQDLVPLILNQSEEPSSKSHLGALFGQAAEWVQQHPLTDNEQLFLWLNGDDEAGKVKVAENSLTVFVREHRRSNGGLCARRIGEAGPGDVMWGGVAGWAILSCQTEAEDAKSFLRALMENYAKRA